MKKRAQGLSVDTIIIAAIALLVLVVLSVIFIGRGGRFGLDVEKCINKGGTCVGPVAGAERGVCSAGQTQVNFVCENENEVCCLPIA